MNYSSDFDIPREEWDSWTDEEKAEYVEEFMQENPHWHPDYE